MRKPMSASGEKHAESLNQVLVTLNTLARALVAIEDPRQTLEEIARSAQQVLEADIVDLYQYIQDQDAFILPPIQVGDRRHNDLVITKVYPDDVSAMAVKLGKPQYFVESQAADILTGKFETPRVGGPSQRFVFREGIISSAVLPLTAADEIVGVMFVNYRSPQAFNQAQRNLIESFANLAAIAIYNARLLKSEQNRRQQSETFQAITHLVSSTAVFEDIANSLLAELGKILDYDSASIQLFEGDRRILVGGRGFLKGDAPYELRRNVSEDPLISQIVQDRQPMVLSDISNEPLWDHIPQTKRVQSWMGVPFIFKDQVLGLLTLDHTEIGHYTQRSEDVAVAFANQVASAIYNSKQTQALAELNKLMHQLIALEESPQGVRKLLEQIAKSALDVLKADIVDIYEYVQREDRFELPRIRMGDVRVSPIDASDINESSSVFELIQRETPLYEVDTLNNPVFSNDYPEGREPRFEKRFAVREGIRSTAVVPLRSVDETVGLVFASYRMPQAFTSDQKERIELFANQAAVAIHNAQLYEQRIRDVEALQRISAAITSEQWSESTDLSRILRLIAEELMEVFNAASCAIRLYNSDTRQFTARVSAGLLEDKIPDEPRADGTSEHLIETKSAIFAEDSTVTIGDSDSPAIRKEFQEAGVVSIAYLPLVSGEDVIGALYVNWDVSQQFPQNAKRVLRLFADQAVNAIESVRLLRELAQRAELLGRLQEVTTAISAVTSDVGDVLHLIVRRINDVFPETSCEIRLYDPIKEKFTKERVAAGILEKEVDYVPREGGTSAHVVKDRKPFYAENTTRCLSDGTPAIRERIASQGVQAVATLPLVSKKNAIGTLYVYWFELHPFTGNDKQVLELFADHAAIAITNTQMYSDLQQRQRDLSLLNEASRTFSSKLDLEEVLTRVLDQVRELLGIVASSIWLIDPEAKMLICQQASGPEYERVQGWQMNLGEGLVGLAAQKGERLIVGDAQADERHFSDVDQATGLELHSILSVPLKFQGNVIGVLQVLDKAVERFDAADQTLLESLGASAAIAIENARLFEQVQEQREEQIVEAIRRIGVNIAEVSDLDAILDDLLDDALYLMGKANLGEIRLYEPDTDELVVRASRGQSLEEEFTRNKIGEGITGWVALHRDGRIVGDVTSLEPPDYLPFLGDTKSEIAVPMLSGDELVGVLNIESPELNAFSEDDLHLLEAIASQGVIAIENNKLYEQSLETNRQLQEALVREREIGQFDAVLAKLETEAEVSTQSNS